MAAEQDQIVFVMTVGNQHFYKSVDAGTGHAALEDIIRLDEKWIEVDDSRWIVRDNVVYAYVVSAGDNREPLIA
jgi:hypothetical protein